MLSAPASVLSATRRGVRFRAAALVLAFAWSIPAATVTAPAAAVSSAIASPTAVLPVAAGLPDAATPTPVDLAALRSEPLVITPVVDPASLGAAERALLSGHIATVEGDDVSGATVEVFGADGEGGYGPRLDSRIVDRSGTFTVVVPPGCYVVVLSAPEGRRYAGGGRRLDQPVCVASGPAAPIEARLVADLTSGNGGNSTPAIGNAVPARSGTKLGESQDATSKDTVANDSTAKLDSTKPTTSKNGNRNLTATTKPGTEDSASNNSASNNSAGKLDGSRVSGSKDAASRKDGGGTGASGSSTSALSPVEQEIVRLTNELRADPSGPLDRLKPLPACVHDPFYGISIDPATGAPRPVAPLAVDEQVSAQMARTWAAEMDQSGQFRHRTTLSEQRTYRQLGRKVSAWGENISWFSGFDPALTARTHFEGWRESDTGHYCALLTGRFTHIGVGEHRVGDQSWAVQNFYQ